MEESYFPAGSKWQHVYNGNIVEVIKRYGKDNEISGVDLKHADGKIEHSDTMSFPFPLYKQSL